MLITSTVKELVLKIESTGLLQPYLSQLIAELAQNIPSPVATESLPFYYPLDSDGYARSFDPLTEEDKILAYWNHYGFVVSHGVVSEKILNYTLSRMQEIMHDSGMNLENEETYPKDKNGTAFLSRGFFELYHDNSLAQIRQSLRLYLHHVILWQTPYLWTTFDRLGIKMPKEEGLNLHVDQNPNVHPGFRTIQGVLAMKDCPIEQGTFVASPASKEKFCLYCVEPGYTGEYVPLTMNHDFPVQAIPLRAGSIVSWDSRTTHANSANLSHTPRYVAYVSTGIARNDNHLIEKRRQAFDSGLGENLRDAYMHASKKPRFTDSEKMNYLRVKEELNELGEYLYGFKQYDRLKDMS